MDCKEDWFLTVPKYTTVRINALVVSRNEVAEMVSDLLTKEALSRGMPVPCVCKHSILPECLVISPWSYKSGTQPPLPRFELEVIVDAACGVAVLRGAHVFAPGVLGLPSSTQEEDLVSVFADSNHCCKRGLTTPFQDSGKVFVGNGVMKMSRKHLFEKDLHPKGIAVEIIQSTSGVASVIIPQHMGILQNLPSIVCSHVVAPKPGEKVIDLCAAPGHKTTHLAALMGNDGVLIALDKIARKVEALHNLCQEMQAVCVKTFTYDSVKAISPISGPDWAPPYAHDTFDRVLLDAPCSAVGQRPQLGRKMTSKQLASYPKLQKKLFVTAVQLLKPGGTLVYSTCSLMIDENENMVSWALNSYPQLELVPATPFFGKTGVVESLLGETDCQKVQRFGPPFGATPEEDTIGFFIAKFIKNS